MRDFAMMPDGSIVPAPKGAPKDPHGGRYHLYVEREKDGEVNTFYADRMNSWDHEKYQKAKQTAFGDTREVWQYRDGAALSAFLSAYVGYPVRCIALIEYTDGYGYPSWRFDMQTVTP